MSGPFHLERRDPDSAHLEHVVRAARAHVPALLVPAVLVAGVCPRAMEGAKALLALVPVGDGRGGAAHAELADVSGRDRLAVLADELDLVPRDRLAPGRPVAVVAGTVGEEDVQHLGGPDPVEGRDPEPLLPRPRDPDGKWLPGGYAATKAGRARRPVVRGIGEEVAVQGRHPEEEGRLVLAQDLHHRVRGRGAPGRGPRSPPRRAGSSGRSRARRRRTASRRSRRHRRAGLRAPRARSRPPCGRGGDGGASRPWGRRSSPRCRARRRRRPRWWGAGSSSVPAAASRSGRRWAPRPAGPSPPDPATHHLPEPGLPGEDGREGGEELLAHHQGVGAAVAQHVVVVGRGQEGG